MFEHIKQFSSQIVTSAISHINATQANIFPSVLSTTYNHYNNNDISEYTGLLHITRKLLQLLSSDGKINNNNAMMIRRGLHDNDEQRITNDGRSRKKASCLEVHDTEMDQYWQTRGRQNWGAMAGKVGSGRQLHNPKYQTRRQIKLAIKSVANVPPTCLQHLESTPFTRYLSIVYDVGSQNSRRRLSIGGNGSAIPMKPIENIRSYVTKGYKNVCGCEVAK